MIEWLTGIVASILVSNVTKKANKQYNVNRYLPGEDLNKAIPALQARLELANDPCTIDKLSDTGRAIAYQVFKVRVVLLARLSVLALPASCFPRYL